MALPFYYKVLPILLYFKIIDSLSYKGMIAEHRTVSECMNGPKILNSELEITTAEMIKKQGYAAEEHLVQTEDGYLLTLHRIPGPTGSPVVLLQHGFLLSSFDYTANGKGEALAFLLADEGYDVWLGNLRGNLYSKCHIEYPTLDNRYWNFSFHEMGLYDLPAQINYITNIKNEDIIYVGHSMGTTSFYIMAIERPDIASKVKAMFGLAPVAFIHDVRGITAVGVPFAWMLDILSEIFSSGEVFSQTLVWKIFVQLVCTVPYLREICADIIFILGGFNAPQLNYTRIPLYFNHFPTGSSSKTLLHFAQNVLSRKFRHFDYGKKGNLAMYNTTEVPEYDLTKINVPVGIFYSDNDFLSTHKNAKGIYKLTPRKILQYKVPDPKFNHFDFIWGINAKNVLYKKLISVIKNYR